MNKSLLPALLVASLTAVANVSQPITVDTRNNQYRIENFYSDYCSGEYGIGENKAYFIADYSGFADEIEFTVACSSKDIIGFIYSDNPFQTTSSRKYKVSLRNKAPGYALTVVGVTASGEMTPAFRANFDFVETSYSVLLASAVDDNKKIKYTSGRISLKGLEVEKTPDVVLPTQQKPDLNATGSKMKVSPVLSGEFRYTSNGNAELRIDSGAKRNGALQGHDARGRFTEAYGFSVDFTCSGSLLFAYDSLSRRLRPSGGSASFKLVAPELAGKGVTVMWPGIPLYANVNLGVSGEARLFIKGDNYNPDNFWDMFSLDAIFEAPILNIECALGQKQTLAIGAKGKARLKIYIDDVNGLREINAPVSVSAFARAFKFEYGLDIYNGTFPIYTKSSRRSLSYDSHSDTGLESFRLEPKISDFRLRKGSQLAKQQIPSNLLSRRSIGDTLTIANK